MLQCRQCGSIYDDEGECCNQCQHDLNDRTSVYVIDADEAKVRYLAYKKSFSLLQKVLALLMLFFPFAVYFCLLYTSDAADD